MKYEYLLVCKKGKENPLWTRLVKEMGGLDKGVSSENNRRQWSKFDSLLLNE
jgi:hypothetical protein